MSDGAEKLADAGVGLLSLLAIPGVGIILLVIGIILLLVMLGFAVWIYITLQSLHLLSAVIFGACALFMFVVGVKAKVITNDTMKKYPWLILIIPGAALFGYVSDMARGANWLSSAYSVSPLATATPEQGTANFVVVLVLFVGVLTLLHSLWENWENRK